MTLLATREWHERHQARFAEVNGQEVVAHYGDLRAEHRALRAGAGLLDLRARGRFCLTGGDAVRFLNAQVTNNVKDLAAGQGCYAAALNAKGKMVSDLHLHRLEQELLLDVEPGFGAVLARHFEQYIIADDVQIVDVAASHGLISIQGPRASECLQRIGLVDSLPAASHQSKRIQNVEHQGHHFGELYLIKLPRLGSSGFDLFAPVADLPFLLDGLAQGLADTGIALCGWDAFEVARVEAGIPRFGADMNDSNLPPEAGLDTKAISYTKGCYLGQEVMARLRAHGQVAKVLRGLRLADDLPALPAKGAPLRKDGKEVGYLTTAVRSLTLNANIALGYVRREINAIGTELAVGSSPDGSLARIIELPFCAHGAGPR